MRIRTPSDRRVRDSRAASCRSRAVAHHDPVRFCGRDSSSVQVRPRKSTKSAGRPRPAVPAPSASRMISAGVAATAPASRRPDGRNAGCASPCGKPPACRDRHRRRTGRGCCRRRPPREPRAAFSSCSSVTPRERGVAAADPVLQVHVAHRQRDDGDARLAPPCRASRKRPRVRLARQRAAMADQDPALEIDAAARPRRCASARRAGGGRSRRRGNRGRARARWRRGRCGRAVRRDRAPCR